MANPTTMFSQRGELLLIINEYKYSKAHVSKDGKVRWRCIKKGCQQKVYTKEGDENYIILENASVEHNHAPDIHVDRQIFSNSTKRKAVEDICERPLKIVHKELRKENFSNLPLTTKDISCVRRNIYAARRKSTPPLPKSQEEVLQVLVNLNLKTNRGENFLLSTKNNSAIFSCFSNLHFLCNVDSLYIDGTFQYCSKYFCQMFTIHGYKNGFYVPLVFCLLTNKSQQTYRSTFDTLITICTDLNLNFKPKRIISDFEIAIQNAAKLVWPDIIIFCCKFHLTQNWFRKIQNLGLSSEYKNQTVIGKYLKLFFGIPYLHPNEVGDFFLMNFLILCQKMTEFCNFVITLLIII